MRTRSLIASALLGAGILSAMVNAPAAAQTTAQTTELQAEAQRTDMLAAQHGTARVQTRISNEFSTFAGSEANAHSLVTGLRTGSTITLASSSPGGTTAVTFDPPTRPMGHGNVYISLALARHQLAGYGITNPTPQELQAALTGGTIVTGSGATAQTVTLQGVLNQRADGMGWGQIARSQGTNLGHVVTGLRNANAGIVTSTAGAGTAGITTATGASPSPSAAASAPAHGKAAPPSQSRGVVTGSGIVTATGARPAGVVPGAAASAQAGVRAGNAGIVTGAGAAAGTPGAAQAQGHGKGLARP
jgi:hypothetical protein